MHEADQLIQWLQCRELIEAQESSSSPAIVAGRSQHRLYSHVAKLRPDDLFFGPMVPWCVLRPDAAYFSRQQTRFSDQLFVAPRAFADELLGLALTLKARRKLGCSAAVKGVRSSTGGVRGDEGRLPELIPFLWDGEEGGPFHLESEISENLMKLSKARKVPVELLHLPRILSRAANADSGMDVMSKCKRFLWSLPRATCIHLASGGRFCGSNSTGLVPCKRQ